MSLVVLNKTSGKRVDRRPVTDADADILTAEEAAAYLRLTRRTLYVLAKEGKIPASRVATRGASAALHCVRKSS